MNTPADNEISAVQTTDENSDVTPKPPNFLQIMLSVIAAAFGVQTGKNYERDFTTGSPLPYIVGGVVFTALFVLTIVGVVSLVLP
ncbi:MAG: hypothetical protein ACI9SB_000342 [Candidatus Azotimanducaceae bacterium]|jgi:hypothetical protein